MLRKAKPQPPVSDFDLPRSSRVVQICHPDWRGVRTSAEAFGDPVIELSDLAVSASPVIERLIVAGTERIVIQGWPPGAEVLARLAVGAGIAVSAVSHSSMAQHGTDAGEAEAVSNILDLAHAGVLDRIGFIKHGLAEAFTAMGYPAHALANRSPVLPPVSPDELGSGDHAGIFLYPYWRKNVTTQIAAVLMLGATAHVMQRPAVGYLPHEGIVEHGELPRHRFLALLGATNINLHVTLSECHPMTPMESYLLGVPCLVSRTSALFTDDPELLAITTVVDLDDPMRIAAAVTELRASGIEVVERARASLRRSDVEAASAWAGFTS